MKPLTRRKFVQQSALAAVATVAVASVRTARGAPALSLASRILGANDDVRIAVVGVGSAVKIGGKGKLDIRDWRRTPGARVVAICDVDQVILDAEVALLKGQGVNVDAYTDIRKLLENQDIDALSVTTPNHWHALVTIWACQAGKDVFVQKPASHNMFEGRKMVEAARKYRRVVQVTSSSRHPGVIEAMAWGRKGGLGKVLCIHGVNYKPRISIGKVTLPTPIPSTLDYDLWSGPAPIRPVMREFLHYDWHWDWNYGNGDLGNMGIHYLDGCRIAVGLDRLPRSVISMGGRFAYRDDGMTPNSLLTFFDYESIPVIFEVRGLPRDKSLLRTKWDKDAKKSMDTFCGAQTAVTMQCEDGCIVDSAAYDRAGKLLRRFGSGGDGMNVNFVKTVRSRDVTQLQGDVLQGHLSAAMIHLANASYRVGRTARPEEIRDRIPGQKEPLAAFERFQAHLDANGIDPRRMPTTLGAMLTVDPATERFVGEFSGEANPLLTREYRAPFVVPERV
jgi:predicted dehydrogenase